MKIIKTTSLIFLLSISYAVIADKDKDKSLLDNDNNYSSDYKTKYTLAENYISAEKYQEAINVLLQLDSMIPQNANVNYYLGLCYLNSTNEKSKAISPLNKAITKVSPNYKSSYSQAAAPLNTYYLLGQAYHVNGKYEEAISAFKEYKNKLTKKDPALIKDVDYNIEMCQSAIKLTKNPRSLKVELFNPDMNTKYSDCSIATSADHSILIFATSPLPKAKNSKPKSNQELFITAYNNKSKQWLKPAKIEAELKSISTENTFSSNSSKKEVFINKDNEGNKDIYNVIFTSNKEKGILDWSDVQKVNGNINSKFNETNACLNADGSTMYFVSDREGGFGGKDIWASEKMSNGTWGKPYNLGSKINTPKDEESPFMLSDGATLYFSSKGHNTMGGYDVFFTTLSDDGFWSNSENVGYPINTPLDDLYYIVTPDEKSAFYSSSKLNGIGDTDIYFVEFE